MDMRCGIAWRAPTEKHVQAMWFDDALRPAGLKADGGIAVRVVDPGRWNGLAGPDFKGAVLRVGRGGRMVAGDVEIHVDPADWTRHAHAGDPAYANVVAHVVWQGGARPKDLPCGVLQIPLAPLMAGGNWSTIDVAAYPQAVELPCEGACRRDMARKRREDIEGMLLAAGRKRLEGKADAFAQRLKNARIEDVFHEAFLEALGWKGNESNFRHLARLLPADEVPQGDAGAAFAAFHGAALLVEWNRVGIRPNNMPEARLGAAARVCSGLREYLNAFARCDWARKDGVKAAVEILRGDGAEGGFPSGMGGARAAAMAANVVWPLMRAAGFAGPLFWLPAEDLSAPVRETARRLFGRDHNPAIYSRNGLMIQGLLHISKELCGKYRPSCGKCPLAGCAGVAG
ncbi:MAG: DUF2851 family protein [Kiritimatiellae bacterium]|nr:DUF2851 family protein [Kiritimatiellia bacterium]